ncbi:Transcriptional coactivator/pterin dehydratase [Pseudocohnilembus persalinus]|uniref:4a-hydroxytetrahydrobiopterin dehydratase n=1 Tax=Pseudocohnilembus persalinus TaxID=266149 RepID=A0A0V0QH87_PSEPJ|nr:Transcriptional coactivator/pterin dehydratase [Pseudocohnilembus persalinus]|eukprot:KRX01531.1 Transcriptional coactivator/pterin dehydratase [Pseudocohnilembus persalinus]
MSFKQLRKLPGKSLNSQEITESFQKLQIPVWEEIQRKNSPFIEKVYVFKSFQNTINFMQKVAYVAEQVNHHPEWDHDLTKLKIYLQTHKPIGISIKDIYLAYFIEQIYQKDLNLIDEQQSQLFEKLNQIVQDTNIDVINMAQQVQSKLEK